MRQRGLTETMRRYCSSSQLSYTRRPKLEKRDWFAIFSGQQNLCQYVGALSKRLFATTHCEKRTISLLSRVPIFTCPKMGVVNTQIQTETTFITAKPEKWLTFFVVVAEIVFICMDTSHVKRKIDSQNFVIFSDTNTPLLYLQKDYMLTGIYLCIISCCCGG